MPQSTLPHQVIHHFQLKPREWHHHFVLLFCVMHGLFIMTFSAFSPASIMEITDANLKRLQESLSGSANSRHAATSSANSAFPASASGGFHRPTDSARPQMETIKTERQPAVRSESIEQKVTFDVADDEVNALIPPIPSSFPEIDSMALSEAKCVVDNKDVLETFVEGTSGVKTLRELKQSIETSNVNAACSNLENEEQMKEVCSEVETLKQDLNTKMEQYQKLDDERRMLTQPPDLQDAIRELTKAKKDAYRESEELAEEWVESGGENVTDFVKKFMEVRILYHERAAKAERLETSM